jgi:N-acetylglucosaminyldiphosphoundecaprenol N-acetyl-beta-D-mannosaminyltransferase
MAPRWSGALFLLFRDPAAPGPISPGLGRSERGIPNAAGASHGEESLLTLELDHQSKNQFNSRSSLAARTSSANAGVHHKDFDPAHITLMSVRLDNLSEEEAAEHVVSAAQRGEGGRLVNPNVDVMRQVVTDRSLGSLLQSADLVLPDGMPLLWAARLQGSPLKERVPVSEAINTLCDKASERDVGVFLLGGSPGTAERAAEVLKERSPQLSVDYFCPPFGFEGDEVEMDRIFDALEVARPGIVFCAFGFPKQERLMSVLSERFPATWFVGSGGTFSMVAGDTPKAPTWMRNIGLEWAHRLRLEPRRLFERYIVHDLPFACRMLASSAVARVAGTEPANYTGVGNEETGT